MPRRPYLVGLLERLQDDPEYVKEYLNAALDESHNTFLLALRDVAEAEGMAETARRAHLNRENLYRMLSASGNPRLNSLVAVLDALDFQIRVVDSDRRRQTRVRSTRKRWKRRKIRHGRIAPLNETTLPIGSSTAIGIDRSDSYAIQPRRRTAA